MTREEYNRNKNNTGSRGGSGNVGAGTSAHEAPSHSGPIISDERDKVGAGNTEEGHGSHSSQKVGAGNTEEGHGSHSSQEIK